MHMQNEKTQLPGYFLMFLEKKSSIYSRNQ